MQSNFLIVGHSPVVQTYPHDRLVTVTAGYRPIENIRINLLSLLPSRKYSTCGRHVMHFRPVTTKRALIGITQGM